MKTRLNTALVEVEAKLGNKEDVNHSHYQPYETILETTVEGYDQGSHNLTWLLIIQFLGKKILGCGSAWPVLISSALLLVQTRGRSCSYNNLHTIFVWNTTICIQYRYRIQQYIVQGKTIGKRGRRSSRSVFGQLTGNDVSGHYKRYYFFFFSFFLRRLLFS